MGQGAIVLDDLRSCGEATRGYTDRQLGTLAVTTSAALEELQTNMTNYVDQRLGDVEIALSQLLNGTGGNTNG